MLSLGLYSPTGDVLLLAYMLGAGPSGPTVDELSAPDVHLVFLQKERTSPIEILPLVPSGSGKFSTRSHTSTIAYRTSKRTVYRRDASIISRVP
jgi:hypothetical protein